MNGNKKFDGLTIMIAANDGTDNMASLQVLADELKSRGHRIVFSVDIATNGIITSYKDCTDFDLISHSDQTRPPMDISIFDLSAIELFENHDLEHLKTKLTQISKRDYYYSQLIERIRPDVIIIESRLYCPALTNCQIPWLWLNFGNPNQFINDERLPPMSSGLSMKSSADKRYEFKARKDYLLSELREEINEFCVSKGVPLLSKNELHPRSPYLNVYIYPRELDYDLGKSFPPKGWLAFDSLMRDNTSPLDLPDHFKYKPGKIVYLALDMYNKFEESLITRLVPILSATKNKFIASKELFPAGYQLPDNILSLHMLSVSDAIKASDLVMTCGDTKTLTEAMFFGKPMVIMPLFGQQMDNAQRAKACGLAVSLEPHRCQVSTTYGSINALLEDVLVSRICSNISYRMKNSNDIERLCDLIEDLPHKKLIDENNN